MKIIVYTTTDPDVPEGLRHIARIRCMIPSGKGGKLTEQFHPVLIQADSAEAARANAEAWWNSELEKAAAKAKPKGRPKKAEAAQAEDYGDIVI